MNYKYIENLKLRLTYYKTQIKNLFNNNKLIKDILENALITILTNEKENLEGLKNNFCLLSIQNISICPLVNLPFKYNGIKIDLNKEDIIETATSYIPILFYKSTFRKFSNNFKVEKIKENIIEYINSHEFYFVDLDEDINGITIHTGDIFLNIKYLREYFEEINFKDDNNLIIKEKIMLVILYELNHGLLRIIDSTYFSNYLINFKRTKFTCNKNIKYKGLKKGEIYNLPIEEIGNNFEYLLYGGFYFEYLDINMAIFFQKLKSTKIKMITIKN